MFSKLELYVPVIDYYLHRTLAGWSLEVFQVGDLKRSSRYGFLGLNVVALINQCLNQGNPSLKTCHRFYLYPANGFKYKSTLK